MRYRLLAQHYSEEDKLLEPGTVVGDGTPFLWTRPPTTEMEGLDDASCQAIEREKIREGTSGLDPLSALRMTGGEAGDIEPKSVPIMNHPNERPTRIGRSGA